MDEKILAGDVGGEYVVFIMMEANNDQQCKN